MNVIYKASFEKDIRKHNNAFINKHIVEIISDMESAKSISEIHNIKKIVGFPNYYRIRIGDYRLGFFYDGHTVYFVRVLHRSEIYKHFP